MKENIEDISADIELQYGQANMERNIAYVLSLVEAHVTEDGRLDDDVPVPSIEAVVKTILLLVDRPELSWETICREQRVKHVMEYLFIRARNHPDEVHGFVDRLLKQYVPEIPSQMVRIYLNVWKHIAGQSLPTKFTDEILYPEHSEKILTTLRFLLQGEVGRGAALVMVCARDEGLVRDIAHAKVVTEFCHVTKTAYNNYLHERFTEKEKKRTIGTLRTKIGYTKEEDGRIVFLPDSQSRKSVFLQLWRMMKSLAE
ncbi:hypothetical protein [Barnesiella intestinihominis]|uniref:hypothetical protein n=1 Tax=Barnesiella intestinihominis TaxID=487174 RepID=UPI0039677D8C